MDVLSENHTSMEYNAGLSISFTKPSATSSPRKPNTPLKEKQLSVYLKRKVEEEITMARDKLDVLKEKIKNVYDLEPLKCMSGALHYVIEEEDSQLLKKKGSRKKLGGSRRRKVSSQESQASSDSELMLRVTRSHSRHVAMATPAKASINNTRTLKNRGNYQVAVVTPRPNKNAPISVLRRPNPGEVPISLTGSPLLVASELGPTSVPQITIPLEDGTVMAVLGKDGLNANDFPGVNRQIISPLQKLERFLREVLKDT